MVDNEGYLTQAEINLLNSELENLALLPAHFNRMDALGMDTKADREEYRKRKAEVENMLKVLTRPESS